jgi:hypothetical protein
VKISRFRRNPAERGKSAPFVMAECAPKMKKAEEKKDISGKV